MLKVKVSKKQMKENYHIIGVGYCDAQNLLRFEEPIAYSAGVNGWSCNYYDINNVVISTGYSYINNKNTNYNYDTLKAYEEKARAINSDYNLTYGEQKRQVKALLNEFVVECVK